MSYHGDIRLGDTIDFKFTTRQISGAPFTLAGSPVISAYPANSTTQLTAGITLTVDFDSVTGLNHVRVVATTANGYLTATDYKLVITTGTVNSVSVVGEVIGSFSIENRVINRAKLDPDTGMQSIRSSTAQTGGGSTSIKLDTGASAVDNAYQYRSILLTGGTGAGGYGVITSYVGSTRVATIDTTWQIANPDNTTTFAIFPAAETAATIAAAVCALIKVAKGVAFPKFMFMMTDSTNHNPATGKTVTVTISKDGGAFAALNSGDTVTEIGSGWYEVDLSSTDTNANNFALKGTATGCDDAGIHVVTAG